MNCSEPDCGFTRTSTERAALAGALADHLRDGHGKEMARDEAERRVFGLPPPTPGTPARNLR